MTFFLDIGSRQSSVLVVASSSIAAASQRQLKKQNREKRTEKRYRKDRTALANRTNDLSTAALR